MPRRGARFLTVATCAAALGVIPGDAALAADPGLWVETGRTNTSVSYWQGITFDADPLRRKFFFDGVATGLYRTNASLSREAGTSNVIPADVKTREGYNHLGDLSYDPAEGRRVLLPLECYYAGQPNGGNTCQTGSIGVADAATLAWRYYVKLDPAYIKKAMWNEVSPDGRWIWTSSGTNLLAYSAAEVTATNAAPNGPKLQPKLARAVLPASGVTGATFYGGRLYVAINRGGYFQVQSYGVGEQGGLPIVSDGPRLEIERTASSSLYESEGLATADALGGATPGNQRLHWQIHPQSRLYGRIIHFRPAAS